MLEKAVLKTVQFESVKASIKKLNKKFSNRKIEINLTDITNFIENICDDLDLYMMDDPTISIHNKEIHIHGYINQCIGDADCNFHIASYDIESDQKSIFNINFFILSENEIMANFIKSL
jgi:hypothetical protein